MKRQAEVGKGLVLNWISPHATGKTQPEKGRMVFDANLIKGIQKINATLYADLYDEGEVDLARDIVEQSQMKHDKNMVEIGQQYALPTSESSARK